MANFSIEQELSVIDDLLDRLEELDPERKAAAAKFVITNIIPSDDEPPASYKVASNYLKWVIAKGTPRQEFLKDCKCTSGWVEKEDGTVYPCDKCRAEYHEKWWTEWVDEERAPV